VLHGQKGHSKRVAAEATAATWLKAATYTVCCCNDAVLTLTTIIVCLKDRMQLGHNLADVPKHPLLIAAARYFSIEAEEASRLAAFQQLDGHMCAPATPAAQGPKLHIRLTAAPIAAPSCSCMAIMDST